MKRNATRKTSRKTVITAQKNEKNRKGFRTGMKAGFSCGAC